MRLVLAVLIASLALFALGRALAGGEGRRAIVASFVAVEQTSPGEDSIPLAPESDPGERERERDGDDGDGDGDGESEHLGAARAHGAYAALASSERRLRDAQRDHQPPELERPTPPPRG